MNRQSALGVLGLCSLGGVAIAGWGAWDIWTAVSALRTCQAEVPIDTSAFYFLGLICIPGFPLLAALPERYHSLALASTVALALGMPSASYLGFSSLVKDQGYAFAPPLTLFSLELSTGISSSICQIQTR